MNEYYSRTIKETPDKENPFAFSDLFFQGYNLNKELLEKIDHTDWIGLCFFERKLSEEEKEIVNKLPMIVSNLGIRDNSVLAAMNTAYHGSPPQNVLISYLGTIGGFYNGSKEIAELIDIFKNDNIHSFIEEIKKTKGKYYYFHGEVKNYVGLINYTDKTPDNLKDVMNFLEKYSFLTKTQWIIKNKNKIAKEMNMSINLNMLIAAIFSDLEIPEFKSEAFFIYLFMPFVFSAAIEQKGEKRFPFYNNVNKKRESKSITSP
jgi:hypothetical protein